MNTGLHGSARKAPHIRAELQTAKADTRTVPARNGLNLKVVAKWCKRTNTADALWGANPVPQDRANGGRGGNHRRVIRRPLSPLDDVLACLRVHPTTHPLGAAALPGEPRHSRPLPDKRVPKAALRRDRHRVRPHWFLRVAPGRELADHGPRYRQVSNFTRLVFFNANTSVGSAVFLGSTAHSLRRERAPALLLIPQGRRAQLERPFDSCTSCLLTQKTKRNNAVAQGEVQP